jgi:ABC-type transporter Mla subunit MlaD
VETLRFDRVSRALSRLAQALQQKNGADAPTAAQDVLEQLREMERQLNRAGESLSSFGSETETALTEERDQLKNLIERQESLLDRTLDLPEKLLARDPTKPERDIVFPLAEEQSAQAGDTRALSSTLADTSRRTALLSPAISQQIGAAAEALEGAVLAFRSVEVQSAQRQEEKGLELLRDAHDKISESLRNMHSLSQNAATGGALSLRRRGGGIPRGETGDVKIPQADDFLPPAEFRREMLDSMKETYPQDQQGPVQDYYRHWTK